MSTSHETKTQNSESQEGHSSVAADEKVLAAYSGEPLPFSIEKAAKIPCGTWVSEEDKKWRVRDKKLKTIDLVRNQGASKSGVSINEVHTHGGPLTPPSENYKSQEEGENEEDDNDDDNTTQDSALMMYEGKKKEKPELFPERSSSKSSKAQSDHLTNDYTKTTSSLITIKDSYVRRAPSTTSKRTSLSTKPSYLNSRIGMTRAGRTIGYVRPLSGRSDRFNRSLYARDNTQASPRAMRMDVKSVSMLPGKTEDEDEPVEKMPEISGLQTSQMVNTISKNVPNMAEPVKMMAGKLKSITQPFKKVGETVSRMSMAALEKVGSTIKPAVSAPFRLFLQATLASLGKGMTVMVGTMLMLLGGALHYMSEKIDWGHMFLQFRATFDHTHCLGDAITDNPAMSSGILVATAASVGVLTFVLNESLTRGYDWISSKFSSFGSPTQGETLDELKARTFHAASLTERDWKLFQTRVSISNIRRACTPTVSSISQLKF